MGTFQLRLTEVDGNFREYRWTCPDCGYNEERVVVECSPNEHYFLTAAIAARRGPEGVMASGLGYCRNCEAK